MKKYIVVKHNLMRNQKFYKRDTRIDSWTTTKDEAHRYAFRRAALKIAKAKAAAQSECWNGIIAYAVEAVES